MLLTLIFCLGIQILMLSLNLIRYYALKEKSDLTLAVFHLGGHDLTWNKVRPAMVIVPDHCPFCLSEKDVRPTKARQERYRVPNSYRCFNCNPKRSWWTPNPRTKWPLNASPMRYLIWDGSRHLQPPKERRV